MTDIVALDVASWRPALAGDEQDRAIRTIEGGGIVVLPRLAFPLAVDELRFLSPCWSDGRAKNISFDGGALKGARGSADDIAGLSRMVGRFATEASSLVTTLFPGARTTHASTSMHFRRVRTTASASCACSAT
jgi:hypothetical protein